MTPIGNRTRELPACSVVPQLTTLSCAPNNNNNNNHNNHNNNNNNNILYLSAGQKRVAYNRRGPEVYITEARLRLELKVELELNQNVILEQ
jgi:hypothetical protein